MNKPFSLILFDCDGTLVDSEYLNLLAIVETLEEYGAKGLTPENTFDRFSGMRFSQIMTMIAAEQNLSYPQEASARFLQKVRDLTPTHLRSINGTIEILQAIRAQNTPVCVVSNGERNNVLNALAATHLRSFFADDHVFTGLMAPNPKPAPDLYLLATEKMGVRADKNCLVIEDSLTGARAGLAAGMTVWGFTATHHDAEKHSLKLKEIGVSKVFQTMSDLKTELFSNLCVV